MREKLLDLMKNEGLKPSQLAEILEINPAGISHILAGRNKPSFELLQKILRRFPRIDPDWLLLDAPRMYRPDTRSEPESKESPTPGPSAAPGEGLFSAVPAPKAGNHSGGADSMKVPVPGTLSNSASVARVIVLYDDHTFESFTPPPGIAL